MKKRFFVVIIIAIIAATVGTMISQNALVVPPDETHMTKLFEIAETAIEEGYRYEIPDGYTLSFADGSMIVRSDDLTKRGVIKCGIYPNGDTSFVYDRETFETTAAAVVVALISGVIATCVTIVALEKADNKKTAKARAKKK